MKLFRRHVMIKIAVCDDNKSFAEALGREITAFCAREIPEASDCRVYPAFTSAEDVLAHLEKEGFDLIFLDIDMPRITGFDLAERIAELYPETLIIFVSAYDNFVYSSFAYSPFRFLRKSHLKDELTPTLLKAIEKITQKEKTVSFICTDGPITLRTSDISCFESNGNYYTIRCVGGEEYKCRGTITSLERFCDDSRFFKIHSAYIINLEQVNRITDSNRVLMNNGMEIGISRRKIGEFKEIYMQFIRRRYSK